MPMIQIQLDDREWEPLREAAARLNCSEAELVRRLVQQAFAPPPVPSKEWQRQLDALLKTVHQRTKDFPAEEIEADITEAFEEYRRECES